ncbi:MAG: glycosyltransferase [Bacillota bacterium]
MVKKVLIGSSVRQEPEILECFLDSIRDLNTAGLAVDYMFVDDNDDPASSKLLYGFRPLRAKVFIARNEMPRTPFVKDEVHHHWTEELVQRVTRNKNKIMEHCKKGHYDYLLLLDSDLVLHPETLLCLIARGKDIISEIFWTRFRPDTEEAPQVWLADSYTTYWRRRDEQISEEEKMRRVSEFVKMLRRPGVYRVGGLGALTLFSLRALQRGVSFDEIYNVSFMGEDRHLCIRAVALGFELFVDTCLPAYHVYRRAELDGVARYVESFREMSIKAYTHEISTIIQNALENLLSADFRRRSDEEAYRQYFTARGWRELQGLRENRREIARRKMILRAETADVADPSFDDGLSRCDLAVVLNLRGSEEGQRTEKAVRLRVRMVKLDWWKIDGCEAQEHAGPCRAPAVITSSYKDYTRVVRPGPQKLTLAMLVRNEAGRYLPAVLRHAAQYVDEAVILDDASTDVTVEICRDVLQDIPVFIHVNQSPGFANEINIRKQLWDLAVQTQPDWILILDADEMFEDRAVSELRTLISRPNIDVYAFRLFDFWDMEHYREDEFWKAHLRYSPFLVRYQPHFPYQWQETPLHCGRFPKNIVLLPTASSDLRVKHLGWASREDRLNKYRRYMESDPHGRYGDLGQYRSILDQKPRLKKWLDNESDLVRMVKGPA